MGIQISRGHDVARAEGISLGNGRNSSKLPGHISGAFIFSQLSIAPNCVESAVIKQDDDPTKQSPIMDVEISEANGLATADTKSNFVGDFTIPLLRGVGQNESVTLRFLHPDYVPLDLTELVSNKLIIVHLVPIRKEQKKQKFSPIILRLPSRTSESDIPRNPRPRTISAQG